MPELPEVEITTRNLARWTAGRSVVRVELPDPAVVRGRLSTSPSAAVLRGWADAGKAITRGIADEVQVALTVTSQARQWMEAGKVVAQGRWAAFRS